MKFLTGPTWFDPNVVPYDNLTDNEEDEVIRNMVKKEKPWRLFLEYRDVELWQKYGPEERWSAVLGA